MPVEATAKIQQQNMSLLPWRNDPTGLDAYSKNDLDLEAQKVQTEMQIKEQELDKYNSKFLEKAKEAAEASGPKRRRLKSEAAAIKQNYEQEQAAYMVDLKKYTTLKTLANAKDRLSDQGTSILDEMDETELETFRQEVRDDVIRGNQEIMQMEEVADTINETLTAIAGPEGTEVDDDIEEVIQAFEQGEEVSDFSLGDFKDEEEEVDEADFSLSDI